MNEKMNIALFSTNDIWWDHYLDFETYWETTAKEEEELVQFLMLSPHETGCGIDIFVDDGGMFLKYDHPMWLYFRNGRNGDGYPFEVLPISVSENPQILSAYYTLHITEDELYYVKEFIKKNLQFLIEVALGYLKQREFCKKYQMVRTHQEIFEMSRLMPEDSNLPVQIWIDETGTQYGSPHNGSLRIKFASKKGNVHTRDMIPMTVSKTNPEIPSSVLRTNPEARKVDIKIINEVKRFIVVNYEPLVQVLTKQIDYKSQFLYRICTSYDKDGTPIYPKLKDYDEMPGSYLGGKYQQVRSNLGSYNFIRQNGQLMDDYWFDKVEPNMSGEYNVLAYATIGARRFKIHNNGHVEEIDTRPFLEQYREEKLGKK